MNIKKEKDLINRYCNEVGELLDNEKVEQMKTYNHHGKINTHFHSLYVSYICFKIGSQLKVNVRELTQAALLHDLYLYDWHTEKHDEKHAWYHPKKAVENAEKYVMKLTDKQKDMIYSHMWPLHIKPPKSKEGIILTLVDKHCANMDILGLSKSFLPVYNEIIRRTENNNAKNS